jgi:uncharacterized membrane protein
MEKYHIYFLSVHITAGMLALLCGLLAMLLKKGSKPHRLAGKIYFWAMSVVFITAVIMSLYREIPFLLMVAVFSFYGAVTGYRVLYWAKKNGNGVQWFDWASSIFNGLFCTALLVYGVIKLLDGDTSFGIIAMVFASFGITGSVRDISNFRMKTTKPGFRLGSHIGNMIGAYIATVTAFVVTNITGVPAIILWLGPTVLFLPVIFYWQRKIKPKKG